MSNVIIYNRNTITTNNPIYLLFISTVGSPTKDEIHSHTQRYGLVKEKNRSLNKLHGASILDDTR